MRFADTLIARTDALPTDGNEAAVFVGDALDATGWQPDGLYVATLDAGAAESIGFWRGALERGPAFANPRLFPWTLANSVTGHVARTLDVRGPTYTLVGEGDALLAALGDAFDDLDDGLVGEALVVAHDRSADGAVHLAALLLTPSSGSVSVTRSPHTPTEPPSGRAGPALTDLITTTTSGHPVSIGHFHLTPM